mgnify:FL=1
MLRMGLGMLNINLFDLTIDVYGYGMYNGMLDFDILHP